MGEWKVGQYKDNKEEKGNMREIKFRGKNPKDEWVYGSLIINETENEKGKFQVAFIVPGLPCASDGGDFYTAQMDRVKIETIGQYTGLKDKNGKDIYEGDIMLLESFGKCVVWYDKDRCKFELRIRLTDGGYIDKLWSLLTDKYEVIGNIHDNPELLKRI